MPIIPVFNVMEAFQVITLNSLFPILYSYSRQESMASMATDISKKHYTVGREDFKVKGGRNRKVKQRRAIKEDRWYGV